MKKKSVLLLTSFFLLIPSVQADSCIDRRDYTECKVNKYHYYLFSKPYYKDTYVNGTTLDYTSFANYKEWETPSAKEITLSRSCNKEINGNEECWNLSKFYWMWDELENEGKIACNENDSKRCSKDATPYAGSNIIFHFHGANSAKKPSESSESDWNKPITATTIPNGKGIINPNTANPSLGQIKRACASIEADKKLNRINFFGNRLNNGERDNGEYSYIEISRTITTASEKNIWNNTLENNISQCPDNEIYPYNNRIVYSSALYRVKAETTNYYCKSNSINDNIGECNSTKSASEICGKHTIQEGDNRANITINQEGYVTNILTPTEIYQGGGIKLGFIYYNTVSWEYADNEKYGSQAELKKIIKSKLKNATTIQNNINVNIKFKDKNNKEYIIDSGLIQKQCTQTGEFNEGETVTTVCTFLLPESTVELGTGNVTYKNSIGKGINNEYYTPIKYNGDFYFTAKLSNVGVLTGLNGWMEDWKLTYDGTDDPSCKINIYERLYKGNNYRFIYRPIDLKNPFPNRVAGVNWYEWYKDPFNKNRLEESYSKMEYQAELNTQNVSAIKEYNKNNNYLDWTGINENGKSDFVDENVTRVGGS